MTFWAFFDRHPIAFVIAAVWSAAILGTSFIFSRVADSADESESDEP